MFYDEFEMMVSEDQKLRFLRENSQRKTVFYWVDEELDADINERKGNNQDFNQYVGRYCETKISEKGEN